MAFISIDPLGLSSVGLPPIDPLGRNQTPEAEAARRAELENADMVKRLQFEHDQAIEQAAAAKAEAENKAIYDQTQAAIARAAPSGIKDYIKSGVTAGMEGTVGMLDLPEHFAGFMGNLPKRLQNLDVLPSSGIERQTLDEHYTPITDRINRLYPQAPGWENSWTRTIGNIVGPAIAFAPFAAFGAPEATAGALGRGPAAAAVAADRAAAAAPGIVGRVAGPAARVAARVGTTAGAGAAGSYGLSALGDYLGSMVNPDVASMLKDYGAGIGGFLGGEGPGALLTGAYRGLHKAYADATSARRLADRERLGMPINTNVLNKAADVRLDSTTGIPLSGNRAIQARADEYNAAIAEIRDRADAAREYARGGAPAPVGPQDISAGRLGQQAVEVATNARDRINRRISGVFGRGLSERVGRETVLDPITQNQRLEALHGSPTTDVSQQPTIEQFQRDMAANSRGRVVNPALEQTLLGRRAALAARVPPDEAGIAAIDAQRAANRGPTWQQQLTQRSLNRERDTGRPLDAQMREEVRQAQTESLQQAAEDAGIPRAEFERINRRTGELIAQRKSLTPLTGTHTKPPPDTGKAFTTMFGSGGQKNRNRLAILEANNPRGLSQIMANAMEHKMLGAETTGGALPEARTLAPVPAGEWLQSQEPQARAAIARTPEEMARLDALGRVLEDQRGRPTRTNPGTGSNTMGAPATLYQNPLMAAILTGVMSGGNIPLTLTGAALGLAKALSPSIIARIVANRFTNEPFVRQIVHPPTLRKTLNVPRILAAGVSTQNSDKRK